MKGVSYVNDGRITVGLFVSILEHSFSSEIANGAMTAAEKCNVNLVIFSGHNVSINAYVKSDFDYQQNTVFNYALPDNIDVLLLTPGAMGGFVSKDEMSAFLERYKDIPKITITLDITGCSTIRFDNSSGLRRGIEHLIKEHGRRKIGMVSGPSTSDDAQTRLMTYKDTLEANGLEYTEQRVSYGDFSVNSEDAVRSLLDATGGDLDAIVFANDRMAVGGYKVLNERGYTIGDNILVIGFDDSIYATSVSPALTTVRASTDALGYNAVIEGVNLVREGKVKQSVIDTMLIIRGSCGCKTDGSSGSMLGTTGEVSAMDSNTVALAVTNYLFDTFMLNSDALEARDAMYDFSFFLMSCAEKNSFCTENERMIYKKFRRITSSQLLSLVPYERVNTVLDAMLYKSNSMVDETEKNKLYVIFMSIYKALSTINVHRCDNYRTDVRNISWITSSISQDIIAFASDDQNKYGDIVSKLAKIGVQSSFLYTFEHPFTYHKNDKWIMPECVMLKAYHDGNETVVLRESEQRTAIEDLFINPRIKNKRRRSMIVVPLVAQESHFGLLVVEFEQEYFCFLSAITVQICAALKIVSLLDDLEAVQRRLEDTLAEIRTSNVMLSKISRSDELTGILNRRGFFDAVRHSVSQPSNAGRHAIIAFADMDGLKIINDRFGHDEGDFALITAASVLQESFRSTDVVGRIGGDEFAVFALVNSEGFATLARERINSISERVNSASTVPFYVNLSVGIVEFACESDIDIQRLLDDADVLLYNEKRTKQKIIVKP